MSQILGALLVVLFVALVPLCVWQPWIGVLVWHWFGILQPHRYLAGFAANLPLAQPIAIATLAGVVFTRQRYRLPRVPAVYLAGALWIVFVLSTLLTAIDPPRARIELVAIFKSLLMTACTIVLVQDARKLRVLLWVAAVSVGIVAVGGAVWVAATRAVEPLYGPPGGQIGDNNDLAAGLALALPLFAFLADSAESAWLQRSMRFVFAAAVFSILGTHSRSGFLALGIVLTGLACTRRWKALVVAAAAAALFFAISSQPREWTQRMETMTTPKATIATEASMSIRVRAWRTALKLGCDHPLLGAGFVPFNPSVYAHYWPGYSDFHNAHNIFLQVFAEHGLIGLALYVAWIVSALWSLERTARRVHIAARDGEDDRAWLGPAARAVQIGILGYLTSGMFQCLSYREIFLLWIAFAIVLDVLSRGAAELAPSMREIVLGKWREAT